MLLCTSETPSKDHITALILLYQDHRLAKRTPRHRDRRGPTPSSPRDGVPPGPHPRARPAGSIPPAKEDSMQRGNGDCYMESSFLYSRTRRGYITRWPCPRVRLRGNTTQLPRHRPDARPHRLGSFGRSWHGRRRRYPLLPRLATSPLLRL